MCVLIISFDIRFLHHAIAVRTELCLSSFSLQKME